MKPFADSIVDYAQAGWPCVIPVPAQDKHPPPVGYTGADGADTDPLTLVRWAQTHADSSIALRMPDGVIGIDVDHYRKGTVDKRGGDVLAEHERLWGPLPPTWRSSARELPSGIRFYRTPARRFATKIGNAIEIIQRHHRYAVVWPSAHHEVGEIYRWYAPDGQPAQGVPKPGELPELPAAWVVGLREGSTAAGPAAAEPGRGRALLDALTYDARPACAEMANAAAEALRQLTAAGTGGRHDTATERTHHLVMLGAAGHPGAGAALAELAGAWETLTAGEHRGDELARMALTSARKAVTKVGERPVGRDPCTVVGTLTVTAPAPTAARPGGQPPEPVGPPRELHPLEIIGTHPFDPAGQLDQTLADAVLERTAPLLRYATDAQVWLLRGPEVWDTRADLAGWTVALLADRMPLGDPAAERGSPERERSERRRRFMTATACRGVASKMRDRVSGGAHSSALRMTDLDREPWLLWAGGSAWDLQACLQVPTAARIDPATPHRHSAAVAPEVRPTPAWDAFTAAVWPDPELRAWALRVLSIAVTGHSDKALPILVGERDRGKTQVISLIMSVLGSYAHAADPRLLGGADKAHASIIYALMGRRLSFVDEGPREGRVAVERLKQLTGGGELTGNAMHANPVTWAPTHTLVLTANEEPLLVDPAVRARVRLIPCEGDPERVVSTRAAIGHPYGQTWRNESPGVLAALMREAAGWLADPSSALTTAAPEAYRYRAETIAAGQDPVAAWLEEETDPDEGGERSRALYEAFVLWSRAGNIHPGRLPSETKWGHELTRRGYPARHTRTGKVRPLRVRPRGGWSVTGLPVTQPVTQPVTVPKPDPAPTRDGLTVPGDGLVTGLTAYPSQEKPQVKPTISNLVTGVTGSDSSTALDAHTHTHTSHAHGDQILQTRHPSHPSREAVPADPRAAVKLAARAKLILEASGPRVSLPVTVDRSGQIMPLTAAEAGVCLADVIMRGALTVDVETSGYPVGHVEHRLRTVQLGDATVAVVLDAADPAQADVARLALGAAARLHAHSATADLVPLAHAGLTDESAWGRMHDTVIPAKLADPASTGSDPGLKRLAGAVLGDAATSLGADATRATLFKAGKWLTDTDAATPVERSGWAQVDSGCTTVVRYAAADVLDTAALVARLPVLPGEVVERERAVQRIAARVTHRGLRIDGERVGRLRVEHGAAREAAHTRVTTFGIENPGSDRQVAGALMARGVVLPHTQPSTRHPAGQPSVAAGVLEALRGTPGEVGDLVAAVLDHRHHETVCLTFLEPYRQLATRGDSRARPTVYTLGTDTGRMSCVRPNLQQLPRVGGVRACITADPGQLLISADFAGVELRVMAALSQDPHLIKILTDGADLHAMVAEQAFGPEWTKADRYTAKRGVFGWAYGGGVTALARQVGVREHVMAAIVDSLRLIAPGYVSWADEIKRQVRAGATRMPTYAGRVIHLPRQYPHKAPNYCIQGTARELLVDALLRWDATPWGGGVVLPVHDEIVAVVPAEGAEQATTALVECMTTELHGVAITAQASIPSYAWQDAA